MVTFIHQKIIFYREGKVISREDLLDGIEEESKGAISNVVNIGVRINIDIEPGLLGFIPPDDFVEIATRTSIIILIEFPD